MLFQHILNTAQDVLALAPSDPAPTPTTTPGQGDAVLHTDAIVGWVAKAIVPLLLCLTGVYIMGKHRRGNLSEVATASGISIWGLMFIAGGGLFFFVGEKLINLAIG